MTKIDLEDHRIASPIPSIYLIRDFINPEEESYLSRRVDQVGNSNAVIRPDLSIAVRAGGWQRVNGRRSMYWGGTMTPKGKLVPQSPPSFMTNEWPQVFKRLEELEIFSSRPSSSAGPEEPPSTSSDHLPPNHCLVNEYNPGDGILPHLDGPAYLPTVATISLDSDTVYEFHCYADRFEALSEQLTKAQLDGTGRCSNSEADGVRGKQEPQGEPSPMTTTMAMTMKKEEGRAIAPEPLFSLFVPRRSLIIISQACYSHLLHSIPARPADLLSPHLERCINWNDSFAQFAHQLVHQSLPRGRRISLTCRRVERVVKGLDRFLK
ncbi:hypothetical protein PGTUg99_019660 [Puccinia graminis f. sp. tritici]|uniref:Fe2OG dioxygenase domain-containing protein n=2 Tax=Puccinia graminis f. sp. tritici TaxID=56615 RepID=A0A5B0PDT8_PUCGR|nr:hypothetical protein PGTUg99_019660 [Puccinia graminis f. sp. tritici]